ncbi:MAG: HAD family hydrolase [Chloroflexi bacterium]|nr:HAD family hydrolase [Chloroflexota bacterium]
MSILRSGPPGFDPALIVFDKDGTLIHFDAMWGGWVTELADRLDADSGLSARGPLFEAMGYDAPSGRVLTHGQLATAPLAVLRKLTVGVMLERGLNATEAERAVAAAWFMPDAMALAKPLTDIPMLFRELKRASVKIAIATTDDREPTDAMIGGFGLREFVDASVCADDGLPVKPAPDMIISICNRLGVPPEQTVMVGDSIHDMRMGRAAGVRWVVGVLTGVGSAEMLSPLADVVLESVNELFSLNSA